MDIKGHSKLCLGGWQIWAVEGQEGFVEGSKKVDNKRVEGEKRNGLGFSIGDLCLEGRERALSFGVLSSSRKEC